jgi:hypothetical protein
MISGFKTGFEIVKAGSDPAAGAKRVFKLCPGPNRSDGRKKISMDEFRFLIDHGGS